MHCHQPESISVGLKRKDELCQLSCVLLIPPVVTNDRKTQNQNILSIKRNICLQINHEASFHVTFMKVLINDAHRFYSSWLRHSCIVVQLYSFSFLLQKTVDDNAFTMEVLGSATLGLAMYCKCISVNMVFLHLFFSTDTCKTGIKYKYYIIKQQLHV